MKKHYRHENDCLNCGTVLEGKFCHHCGQENLQIKENFGHLMNHAVSDYFHFDHQFFHTLQPLLFKPGKLTNEYMAGKRVQYLHPIKMYIFVSLVFFLLFFKHNKEEVSETNHKKVTRKEVAAVKKQLDKTPGLGDTQKKLILGAVKNAADNDSVKHPENAHKAVSGEFDSVANGKKVKVPIVNKTSTDEDSDGDWDKNDGSFTSRLLSNTDDSTYNNYLATQAKLAPTERDNYFQRMYERKRFDYKKYGSRAKEVFMEELKHNVPKMMFVLLPLFALILRYAFWKNRKYYVEHLIFSFHLHCFLFLFLIITMLLMMLPDYGNLHGWVNFLGTVGIIVYIYKALKTVYNRSAGRTISKMFGIGFVYLMVFSFCMTVLVLITAVTAV